MQTRAAIHEGVGKKLLVDEIDLPDPAPDQVIVKLFSSGVCHSQLHQMHNPAAPTPLVLGHEGTGVVTHVGSAVTHLSEGDKAIVTWVPRTPLNGPLTPRLTGATYKGEPLNGFVYTWAEDVLTDADFVVRIEEHHPNDLSCIVGCAVLTGAGAVLHTVNVRPGDSVAVYGVGGVGLSAIKAAAILEAYPVIAVDLTDDKLKFAKDFGATHLVNASKVDPVEAVKEISGGGVDFAFDAIGARATTEQILPSPRAGGMGAENLGGTAVLIGWPGDEMSINPLLFFQGQRQFRGSLGATYPDKDFPMYLRWHEEGKFPLDQLITERFSLDQINEACDALHAGKILGRAIIEY